MKRKIINKGEQSQKNEEQNKDVDNKEVQEKTEGKTLNTPESYPQHASYPPFPPIPPGPIPPPIPDMRLARAYVPFQTYGRTFEPTEGLMRGTIFPELFMPYDTKCPKEI